MPRPKDQTYPVSFPSLTLLLTMIVEIDPINKKISIFSETNRRNIALFWNRKGLLNQP